MDKAIVLDVETTGLIEPQVIQLAQTTPFEWGQHSTATSVVGNFKNAKPIEPGAMAVHRIVPSRLADCPDWPGWQPPQQAGYLIGHYVDSDWGAVGNPDIRRICTLALAKRAWDGLGSYKLTALIFHLYEPDEALRLTENAHEAECDVALTLLLLDHLLWEHRGLTSFEQLWAVSEEARIPQRIGFSKYGPKNGQPGTLYTDVPTGMLKWIIDPARVAEMDQWEVTATRRELDRRGVVSGY